MRGRATPGDLEEADRLATRAVDIVGRIEDHIELVDALVRLGHVALARGRDAGACLMRARELLQQIGVIDGSDAMEGLETLDRAQAAAAAGKPWCAATCPGTSARPSCDGCRTTIRSPSHRSYANDPGAPATERAGIT